MTEQEREQQKTAVVAEIIRCKGFKTVACTNVKLNPRTFRQWMADDEEFRQAVEDAVEIARDFRDDKAEQKLFEQVRNGEVRFIFGSTSKLGAGCNIQNKLIALHHLDSN